MDPFPIATSDMFFPISAAKIPNFEQKSITYINCLVKIINHFSDERKCLMAFIIDKIASRIMETENQNTCSVSASARFLRF